MVSAKLAVKTGTCLQVLAYSKLLPSYQATMIFLAYH